MNHKNGFAVRGALTASLIAFASYVGADTPAVAAAPIQALTYLHLYVDAQGVSHFKSERLVSRSTSAEGMARPLNIYQFAGAKNPTLVWLGRGVVEDWHKAPRRQFLMGVQGAAEVTAGDGAVRQVTPGTIMLMDDTSGKGHITRSIGKVDHIALVIPVPAD